MQSWTRLPDSSGHQPGEKTSLWLDSVGGGFRNAGSIANQTFINIVIES